MIGTPPSVLDPFPGLRPFEPDETHLFFGREGQVDAMLTRLDRSRFLVVVGASGTGKSSLVKAGVLPAISGGSLARAAGPWRMAVFRPSANPVGSLARALGTSSVNLLAAEATLRRGGRGLVQIVREMAPPGENVLLVVDQFEEVFRLCRSADERDAFVKLLLEAVRNPDPPVYVVLTMRSEYLSRCPELRGLPEALNDNQFLIPRLTRDQLRHAIEGPIAVASGRIAPELVQRILNEIGEDQDQLPVLQHALRRTWDHWRRKGHTGEITAENYDAVGGIGEALSRHANEAFEELRAPGQRDICMIAFQCLTEKVPDQPETRRPAAVAEIAAVAGATDIDVIQALEPFRHPDRGFLLPPASDALSADSVVDISHESLIRLWDRLHHWVATETASRERYLHVLGSSLRFEKHEEGLFRDPALALALKWRDERRPNEMWATRYGTKENFAKVMAYLEQSRQAAEQELERERRARRKEAAQKWLRWLFLITVWVLVGVSALSVVAVRQRNLAVERGRELGKVNKSLDEANTSLGQANQLLGKSNTELKAAQKVAEDKTRETEKLGKLASALQLGAQANMVLEQSSLLSLLLATESLRRQSTFEGTLALRDSLALAPKSTARLAPGKSVELVATSGDGRLAATDCAGERSVCVFNLGTRTELWSAKTPQVVYGLGFNGGTLIVAMARAAAVYEAASGKALSQFAYAPDIQLQPGPDGVAFSAQGGHLAVAEFNDIYLFSIPSGRLLKRIETSPRLRAIALNDDGEFLAVHRGTPKLQILEAASGTPVADIDVPRCDSVGQKCEGFALSGPGRIATVGPDESVRIYEADGGKWRRDRVMTNTVVPPKEVARFGHRGPVAFMAFDRAGEHLVTISAAGTRVLRIPERTETARRPEPAKQAAFGPRGAQVLAGGADGAWIFQAEDGTEIQAGQDCGNFSPDGRYMFACADLILSPRRGWLVDPVTGAHSSSLDKARSVNNGVFSANGQFIAVSEALHLVQVYESATGNLVSEIPTPRRSYETPIAIDSAGQYLALRDDRGLVVVSIHKKDFIKVLTSNDSPAMAGSSIARGLAFSPEGAIAAVTQDGATIFRGPLWKERFQLPRWNSGVFSRCDVVVFSPNGRLLAGACGNSGAYVFDVPSRREILKRDLNGATGLAFSPDGKYLAGSNRTELHLWNVSSGEEVFRSNGDDFRHIAFSPEGKLLLTSAYRKLTRRLWRPPDLINEACARLTRNLTIDEWKRYLPYDEQYRKTCPNLP